MSIPTVALNEATPAGGDKIREGDDRIREFKKQVREILDIDHKYDSSGQDGDMGKHNKVAFLESADLPAGAEGKPILGAQTEDGKAELVFVSEDNADIQLTKDGESLATETPDDSAATEDVDIVNKKYLDDWITGLFSTTAVENKVPIMGTNGYMPNDSVDTTALKTASGEVSRGTGATLLYPAGGAYGFSYQYKKGGTPNRWIHAGVGHSSQDWANSLTTSYKQVITAEGGEGTVYAKVTYVTASGTDWFVYILIDKTTKEIISLYSAPDHPSYGNSGDYEKLPHPFGNVDLNKYEIILLDKETISQLQEESTDIDEETGDKMLATLINEGYKVNLMKKETYIPLHSGKYKRTLENGKGVVTMQMIETIPDFISVRKLTKFTQVEKDEREAKKEIMQQKYKEVQAQKLVDKANGVDKLKKLGLSLEEIEAIRGN